MPQDNIEEIKQKIDVVDLIQEYLQLKPAGPNNFKANCPFHHEKTPSFMVSRDKQIWHCFGCSEGGDIFSFVMKMEGMEFPEALRVLAKKAGVRLQYQDPAVNSQKTRLQDICRAAADFYHKILTNHPKAAAVRDYLKRRGVKEETIEEWRLGFAPDAWETLNDYLVQKKFNEEDIFLAGLTLKKERGSGYLDRFRNRLMFPISDIHGNVIGFGGRWLGKEENMAKYINSPQTLIYNKSYVLYGLDRAKQEIKKEKLAVIVEGYMDCLSSHQAGVKNVVASSGTALTPDQVRILKRYTGDLSFAFDRDLAGDTAARRGIEVAWQQEMNTKIIQFDSAKDPDELIQKNPGAWREAIKKAKSIMEYYFDSTLEHADLNKVEDKKNAAKILLPVIAKLADPIEQTHYLQKLGTLLKVGEAALYDKLKQIASREIKEKKIGPAEAPPAAVRDRFLRLAEAIVGGAMVFPENLGPITEILPPDYLPDQTLRELYKSLIIHYTKNHTFDYDDFIKNSLTGDQELANYANILSLKAGEEYRELDRDAVEKEIIAGVKELKKKFIHGQLEKIEAALRRAEESDDRSAAEELSRKFSELTSELKNLE